MCVGTTNLVLHDRGVKNSVMSTTRPDLNVIGRVWLSQKKNTDK
jgi:hypothetical protein